MNIYSPVNPLFYGYFEGGISASGYSGFSSFSGFESFSGSNGGTSGFLTKVYNRALHRENGDVNAQQLALEGYSFAPVDAVHADGTAKVTQGADWTVLSFWDKSLVNADFFAHATFLLPGVLTFQESLQTSIASFPTVFLRFNYQVKAAADDGSLAPVPSAERDYQRSP